MRLNIASGYEPMPGYVNLDLNPNAPEVDIIGPMCPLDLADGSVEEIRATNCLEHAPYRQTDAVLAEWARVLKRGGTIFVQVPDAENIAHWLLHAPELLIDRLPDDLPRDAVVGAAWRLLGGQDDGEHAKDGDDPMLNVHLALFTSEYLRACMERAGFEVTSIESNPHPNLLARGYKL